MQLKQGTLLQGGKYRIEKTIGQDNFNIVYLAVQCKEDNYVIIKEFFLSGFAWSGSLEVLKKRFLQEGKLLSELNHKYIVRCIDVFEENNTVYYVTRFAEGVNLRDYQEGSTRFDITLRISEQRSITIIKLIAEALDYLHKHGICHLDVKPSNIMYKHVHNEWYSSEVEPDSVTLLDFGCARCSDYWGKYNSLEQTNPTGPQKGNKRVYKGGSFFVHRWCGRSSTRITDGPDYSRSDIGLRLVMSDN